MEHDRDDTGGPPSGGDATTVQGNESGAVRVLIGAEERSSTLGEGSAEGGGEGRARVMPMHSTKAIEGVAITIVSDTTSEGGMVAVVEENRGDVVMEERRTVGVSTGGGDVSTTDEPQAEEGSIEGDTVMVIEMEIGGLDVGVEHRAMEERGTLASAILPEFPFTPLDMPIETENREVEDEHAKIVAS
ncbi:hypothetical protein RHMOL_Rhmol03G0135400 [Rhododendron molle]|uniref:Uncharacterized protein n=1 Tax=Rhododendron molle TaxID=49168 RepID=A0ACC0PDP8_RHOML|nr:hypothetical protein RHMOL_Rhmol03G0135400 [Rhododendron molle]